jgi:hypothetical protein
MSGKNNVWFVTGAGRGMGVDIAKAALAAGHAVVATGHNPEKVSFVLGAQDDPIVLALDVTNLPLPRPPCRRAWTGSAGSMCWSTTRATSTPGSLRSSALRSSGRRSRSPYSPGQRHPRGPAGHARACPLRLRLR